MNTFDQSVIDAVLSHMRDDHGEDNLVIVRANGAPEATEAEMTGFDSEVATWRVTEDGVTRELTTPWPSGKITQRPEIRREVVYLYRNACKTLGVEPRSEEPQPVDAKPFSQVIREGSWSDHDDSEGADFMASIMRGTASLEDYVQLVAQHYFMYEALEAVVRDHAAHEQFAPFHNEDLNRMEALDSDLTHLIGADWRERITPVPATAEYAERIREVGREGWIPGVIAHHYTRYLGDLSGGQMISKRVTRQHGFDDGLGVRFYDFASLGSLGEFKDAYRAELDVLGEQLDEANQTRMLEEVRAAYVFNTAVFIDMARARDAATTGH